MTDPNRRWLGALLVPLCACASSAPLDQHLLQEILDLQDRREASNPALRRHLGHVNATVRAWAARALGTVGATDAAPALTHTLASDPEVEVRRWAAFALGTLSVASVTLRTALRTDPDAEVRATAAWGIGRQFGRPADRAMLADLVRGLDDVDPRVRTACGTGLAFAGDPEIDATVAAACAREPEPRAQAAMLMAAGLAEPRAVGATLAAAALQAPIGASRAVTLAGLRGLATLLQRHPGTWNFTPRERARLRSYLWYDDDALAGAAADALVALAGDDADARRADEQVLFDAGARHVALGRDAVLTQGWARFPWSAATRRAAGAVLERAAVGRDPRLHASALFAFAALQPDAAARILRQHLEARDVRQRTLAVQALAAPGSSPATENLWARARADRSPVVRATLGVALLRRHRELEGSSLARVELHAPAAARILAALLPEEAAQLRVERLARGLAAVATTDTMLRIALMRAIAALTERESSPALDLALLRADEDPAVRRTAQELCGERRDPWSDTRTFRLGIDLPWSTFARPTHVRIATTAGTFVLALDAALAPVHVHRLIDRIRTGRFAAGVRTHASSMVTFGDPAQLQPRCEDLLRRESGPVQLSHSGMVGCTASVVPDCDGDELFVTLAPRPDLQGRVTVVGRVCDGMDVVERLRAGDRFLDITLVPDSD